MLISESSMASMRGYQTEILYPKLKAATLCAVHCSGGICQSMGGSPSFSRSLFALEKCLQPKKPCKPPVSPLLSPSVRTACAAAHTSMSLVTRSAAGHYPVS